MARITPPMNAKGLFSLRLPFAASPTTVYRVSAIRNFEQMVSEGDDPVSLIYTPVGLDNAAYQADLAAGASVIVLMSDTLKPIYVPDTYIDSYPNMGVVPHSWVVASISLGILPDTYDLTRLMQAIKTAVSDDIGVEPTVNIAVAPTTDAITQEQYVQNLNARNAAIKNRSTVYAELLKARAENTNLKQSQNQLFDMIEQLQARIDELEGSAPGT